MGTVADRSFPDFFHLSRFFLFSSSLLVSQIAAPVWAFGD
jgi:hypothetical protein